MSTWRISPVASRSSTEMGLSLEMANQRLTRCRGRCERNVYAIQGSTSGNNRVDKYDASGNALASWGTPGCGDGESDTPTSVGVDVSGNVYVTDMNNHRVQKFTSGGAFIAKWGGHGSGDGQFAWPIGIAVDGSLNVYVCDTFNSRVQKFGLGIGVGGGECLIVVPRPRPRQNRSRPWATPSRRSCGGGVLLPSQGNSPLTKLQRRHRPLGAWQDEWRNREPQRFHEASVHLYQDAQADLEQGQPLIDAARS